MCEEEDAWMMENKEGKKEERNAETDEGRSGRTVVWQFKHFVGDPSASFFPIGGGFEAGAGFPAAPSPDPPPTSRSSSSAFPSWMVGGREEIVFERTWALPVTDLPAPPLVKTLPVLLALAAPAGRFAFVGA
jgi:hypothetical protein